ncbi:hypothetical protein [Devosia sp. A369]
MLKTLSLSALFLAAAASLAACSFSPVYGGANTPSASNIAFAYAAPSSRLEQVVYQRLGLSFRPSDDAPVMMATVSTGSQRGMMTSTSGPAPRVANVTVTMNILEDGKVIFTATRSASASYSTNNQVLANNQAVTDAQERAAVSAAESLRLAVLADYVRRN